MKRFPANRIESASALSVMFKAYLSGIAVVYIYWQEHMPGRPERTGGLTDILALVGLGCLVSSVALVLIGFVQISFNRRRDALWNLVFALLAGALYQWLMPHGVH